MENQQTTNKELKHDFDVLIKIERDDYTPNTTLGKLDIDGEYFCETLEDTVRAPGIKVHGHTAIPSKVFMNVGIRRSSKFSRNVLCLYTEEDKETVKGKGVEFKYVYLHGGNRHGDTLGCPLVAKRRIDSNTIQGTMEAPLFNKISALIKEGKKVGFVAINKPQEA